MFVEAILKLPAVPVPETWSAVTVISHTPAVIGVESVFEKVVLPFEMVKLDGVITSPMLPAGIAPPLPASCLFACFAIVYVPFMYPPDEGGGV